tara:strand:- start:1779 stop:2393 length:615 start_codon:yes stop_codon:yes gene_type:complete
MIEQIDFNNLIHTNAVRIISACNDYWVRDIETAVCGISDKNMDSGIQMINELNISKKEKDSMEKLLQAEFQQKMYKNRPGYKGILLYLINEHKKKIYIGFLLYYERPDNNGGVDILFLLVRNKFRKNGYGTLMLNYVKNLNPDLITSCPDDVVSSQWYLERGFSKFIDLEQNGLIPDFLKNKLKLDNLINKSSTSQPKVYYLPN